MKECIRIAELSVNTDNSLSIFPKLNYDKFKLNESNLNGIYLNINERTIFLRYENKIGKVRIKYLNEIDSYKKNDIFNDIKKYGHSKNRKLPKAEDIYYTSLLCAFHPKYVQKVDLSQEYDSENCLDFILENEHKIESNKEFIVNTEKSIRINNLKGIEKYVFA
jgi:hypothetical protein